MGRWGASEDAGPASRVGQLPGRTPSGDSFTPLPTEKSTQRPAGGVRHAVSNRPAAAACKLQVEPPPGATHKFVFLFFFFFLRKDPSPCYYFGHCSGFGTPPGLGARCLSSLSPPDPGAHDMKGGGLGRPRGRTALPEAPEPGDPSLVVWVSVLPPPRGGLEGKGWNAPFQGFP